MNSPSPIDPTSEINALAEHYSADHKWFVRRVKELPPSKLLPLTMEAMRVYDGDLSEFTTHVTFLGTSLRAVQEVHGTIQMATYYHMAVELYPDVQSNPDQCAKRTNFILVTLLLLDIFKNFDPLTLRAQMNSDCFVGGLYIAPAPVMQDHLQRETPSRIDEDMKSKPDIALKVREVMERAINDKVQFEELFTG